MALTPAQLTTLKAAINAETDAAFVSARTSGNNTLMAQFYNELASPVFWVLKDSLSRHDILTGTSDDGTVFSWAGGAYITRSQGERDAFREMFNSTGAVNPALPTITAAFNDIFSGVGGATNRAHVTAMSRRKVNKFERLFATGTGSSASPGTAVVSGSCTSDIIREALAS